ncbi:hypothetical protein NN3_20850 [Nocardia neocaledoniensis NBRC 108232]|nr:hypothetical protein NN3_20850 [Nocardia neocaledoniensis NBRC 108232]
MLTVGPAAGGQPVATDRVRLDDDHAGSGQAESAQHVRFSRYRKGFRPRSDYQEGFHRFVLRSLTNAIQTNM